jgi:carbamate kinase
VVAFGGNAIVRAGQRGLLAEQTDNLRRMAREIAALIAAGWRVVVTHGNGPQVGHIQLQQAAAAPAVPAMPLDVCGAMSQGQIGYLLEQAIAGELARRRLPTPVASVLTRTLVAPDDAAFERPAKPIGPFYDAAAARDLQARHGWSLVADAGRGFRRVVPSPAPRRLVEREAIRLLVEAGVVVIAAGGGGVPVVRLPDGSYRGVEAVIDKDRAACLLARELGAAALILLTEVPAVAIHYGTPRQQDLGAVSLTELETLAAEGHFPPGSMGPKVEAAVEFVRGAGGRAVVTTPALLGEALAGRAGTRVYGAHPAQPGPDAAGGPPARRADRRQVCSS